MTSTSFFYKWQLEEMNRNSKYDASWIKNIENTRQNILYKLYATGDYNWESGRIYVAIPKDKQLTSSDIKKYNIWYSGNL